jgi:hypothetical protein
MPGPSWALSQVKDSLPTSEIRGFYADLLSPPAEGQKYKRLEDLSEPWRGPALEWYAEWCMQRGISEHGG